MSLTAKEALQAALRAGSTAAPTLDHLGEIESHLMLMPSVMQEDECCDELQLLCRSVDERAELMLDIINGDYVPLETVW